jgi:hypothetical protein
VVEVLYMSVLRLDVEPSALKTHGNAGATKLYLEEVDALV